MNIEIEVKIYPLYSDLMFKYIFGYQKNVRFVEDFLESFYNLKNYQIKKKVQNYHAKEVLIRS